MNEKELNGRDLYLIELALMKFIGELEEDSYRKREVTSALEKVRELSDRELN
jgi:hypothetical protein